MPPDGPSDHPGGGVRFDKASVGRGIVGGGGASVVVGHNRGQVSRPLGTSPLL